MYQFMNGLKLLKGILKIVCSQFKDSFAFLSARSLIRMPAPSYFANLASGETGIGYHSP